MDIRVEITFDYTCDYAHTTIAHIWAGDKHLCGMERSNKYYGKTMEVYDVNDGRTFEFIGNDYTNSGCGPDIINDEWWGTKLGIIMKDALSKIPEDFNGECHQVYEDTDRYLNVYYRPIIDGGAIACYEIIKEVIPV